MRLFCPTSGFFLHLGDADSLAPSRGRIRSEIEREVGMDELKRDIHNQGIMDSLKEVHNDLRSDLHKVQQELNQIPHDVQNLKADHNQHSTVPMEPFPTEAPAHTELANDLPANNLPANKLPAREQLAEPEHHHRPS